MSTAAMAADSNYKRNADQLGMELIGIEFKGPVCAVRHATYHWVPRNSALVVIPTGEETGKETRLGTWFAPSLKRGKELGEGAGARSEVS